MKDSNPRFTEFRNSSPLWKMINKKEQFGLKEKGLVEKALESEYYKGYADACGELKEQIEEFFMDYRDSTIEVQSTFTQEYLLKKD